MEETPVDVALDSAAFAALRARMAETQSALTVPVPDVSQTRKAITQVEPPPATTTIPNNGQAYDAHDPSANGNGHDDGDDGYGGNGFSGNGFDGEEEEEGVALTTLLESLLFVASEPVEPRQLAQTLEQPLEVIELGLAELADYYQRSLRGLRLQRYNDKVQLVTTPAAAPFIEIFLNLDNSTRLSSPALETLAVIAYRQPVTRAQIEAVRGVDCAGVLRSLVQRGLVIEVGRVEGMGRPILYGVTEQFMQHFGLMEMTELPPLEETDADRLWAATIIDEQES
jgi:segregation and condensation protein B